MTQQDAREKALQNAKKEISEIDIRKRCELLEFTFPDNKNFFSLRIFGQDAIFHADTLDLTVKNTGELIKIGDHILFLHYLLYDKPVSLTGDMITFRQLSGGQFYWGPFLSRTVNPLLNRIGNDPDLFIINLDRFDWEKKESGDFCALVHGLGKLYITIVYHRGDEEFPPAIDILFDKCIKDIFVAEDAAVLASRVCIGLL